MRTTTRLCLKKQPLVDDASHALASWLTVERATTMTTLDTRTTRSPEPEIVDTPVTGFRAAPRALEDVRLDRVSSTEWRVSDRRFLTETGRAVIGVVDRVGPAYRVTVLNSPDHTEFYGSLAAARNAFVGRD